MILYIHTIYNINHFESHCLVYFMCTLGIAAGPLYAFYSYVGPELKVVTGPTNPVQGLVVIQYSRTRIRRPQKAAYNYANMIFK